MKRGTLLKIAVAAGVSILIFPFLTLLLIPSEEIQGALTRGLQRQGYVFRADGFGKSFPLGIKARNVLVSGRKGPLLKLDEASLGVKLFPLCTGRVVLDFRAEFGPGKVHARFEPRSNSLSFEVEKLRLEDVPLLRTATGANFRGETFLEGSFSGRGGRTSGEAKLEVKRAALSSVRIGAFPLPDASYESVRGMFRAREGNGTLESLAFQGDGIYIRLKGTVPIPGSPGQTPLDLTVELMPKPAFLENQKLVFLMLSKYQTTPGVYRIPVGGTLLKPSIE